MIRLPISGARVEWRSTTGHDDIALADSRPGLAAALAHVARAVVHIDGSPLDPAALPVGDLDLIIVAGRRDLRGDLMVAEGQCGRCDAAVDVQFSLAAYADHHRARPSRSVRPAADEQGWWRLPGFDVSFRIPVAADVLIARGAADARQSIIEACLLGPVSPRAARAAERAMARLAPTLRADVAGTCPECSAEVLLDVDARELCLSELRFLAAAVYDDVNLIASMYGWTQDEILNLPSARRRCYADLIAGQANQLGVLGVSVG